MNRPAQPERTGPGWGTISKRVRKRDNYRCQLGLPGCEVIATTTTHIIPPDQGGPSTPENLQAACWHCSAINASRSVAA